MSDVAAQPQLDDLLARMRVNGAATSEDIDAMIFHLSRMRQALSHFAVMQCYLKDDLPAWEVSTEVIRECVVAYDVRTPP